MAHYFYLRDHYFIDEDGAREAPEGALVEMVSEDTPFDGHCLVRLVGDTVDFEVNTEDLDPAK